MKQIAVELIRRYASTEINKIITVEASGIAPAIMMGFLLDLPVVFAKKKKPSTMADMLRLLYSRLQSSANTMFVYQKNILHLQIRFFL